MTLFPSSSARLFRGARKAARGLRRVALRRGAVLAAAATATLMATGCATDAPPTLMISAQDIERGLQTDLAGVFEVFRGLEMRRPQVALMPASSRVQLSWNVPMPSAGLDPMAAGWGASVVVSGAPQLNAGRSGINLTDVRVEDIRLSGMPRLFSPSFAQLLDRKGAPLPDLQLLQLSQDQLVRNNIAYGATSVAVTYRGLRVNLAAR